MDTNDEKENEFDKSSEPERDSPDEDVPLWLQGLEDREPDATKPITSENNGSSWIREIDKSSLEQVNDDSGDDQDFDPNDTSVTQDDHEEFSTKDDSPDHQLIETPPEQDTREAIDNQPPEDSSSQASEPAFDESTSPEGFVDISELDLSESTDQEEVFLDDEPLREGELPEWLQEMISETEDKETDKSETFTVEEPEAIDEQALPAQDWTQIDDEPILEEQSDEEEQPIATPEDELDIESYPYFSDEETTPLELPSDEEDLPSPPEEEPQPEIIHPIDHDINLDRAKEHLEQGSYNKAFEIIKEMTEDPASLEKLEPWLSEISASDVEPNSELLEMMGDLALKQGKPNQAFEAYAKAIKYLLMDGEALNEAN